MLTMLLSGAILLLSIPGKKDRERDSRILAVYLVLSVIGFGMSAAYWLGYFPKIAGSTMEVLRSFHHF
ncbi:hypothetical protein [Paenibacillus sp. MBLB4367]|uniref:hypothetical protein n=1 Tax=Paenibacillus sp. MBLB4367 TaxID=3384767 RepID=UPI00390828F5